MKCLVLAGGSGDALWPLSRRNYPKQFIHLNKGRSLFQEAIARNLPFCDEFYIVTNEKYENIVRGQLQVFQGLHYHCFLEEEGRQTAPAVTVACLCMAPSEMVIVVSTDHMIGAGDYNGTIVRAKELLTEECVVALGCHGTETVGHNYFDIYDDGQVEYTPAGRTAEGACDLGQGNALPDRGVTRLLDSGIFLIYAGTYLKAVAENKPALYEACVNGKNRMTLRGRSAVLSREWLCTIPSVSVGEALYEKWTAKGKVKVVSCPFEWSRLLSLEKVAEMTRSSAGSAAEAEMTRSSAGSVAEAKMSGEPQLMLTDSWVLNRCNNVSVINDAREKLVVANELQDVLIVNAKDAVYISKKGKSADIKQILTSDAPFTPQQAAAFDEGDIYYTAWGCKETLNRSEAYSVKKLTVFPGKSLSLHKHEKRSEHWSIVSGRAKILLDGQEREYGINESVFVPMGVFHRIANETTRDLVVIEVSIGESAGGFAGRMAGSCVPGEKECGQVDDLQQGPQPEGFCGNTGEILKLSPACKDYLWGGNRLTELFGFTSRASCIAESWELSAHPAGQSIVADGNCAGMPFGEYIDKAGKEILGWKCQPYERFPMLIKFIDARKRLSVQVHPADAFALSVENDYGKNEMWYILEAEEGAFVYLGFEKDTTKEECQKRLADGTITEILHKVPVKKGDSVFVPAGTVHAINEGLLILEIQQSSNATYRLYDYDRRDKEGNLRPLHLEKAFANLNFKASREVGKPSGNWERGNGFSRCMLEQCKYFSVYTYEVEERMELVMDDSTFYSLVFVSGNGRIETDTGLHGKVFAPGDSFFIPAGRKSLRIEGRCQFVLSHV